MKNETKGSLSALHGWTVLVFTTLCATLSMVAAAFTLHRSSAGVKATAEDAPMPAQTVVSVEPPTAQEVGEHSTDEEAWRKIPSWLKSNPWAIVGYVGLAVMLKLLALGNGDPATAGMILGANGFTSLWSAVSLVAIPGAVLSCYLTSIVVTCIILGISGWRAAVPPAAMSVAATVVALVFLPWLTVLIFGVVACLLGLAYAAWRSMKRRVRKRLDKWRKKWLKKKHLKRWKSPEEKAPNYFFVMMLAAVYGLVAAAWLESEVWFPLERVETESQGVLVGYVIANDGDNATVLKEVDRTTTTVDVEEIATRTRCQTEPEIFDWKVFMGPPGSYVDCLTGK